MKRKKNPNHTASALDEGTDPPTSPQSQRTTFNRFVKSKLVLIFTVLSVLASPSVAESIDCKAGFRCDDKITNECPEGYYSLDGEPECSPCPNGKFYLNLTKL